jgi:hypothetical protein
MTDPARKAQVRQREASGFEPAFRLDLEQQRKRAKELLRAFHADDDPAALMDERDNLPFLTDLMLADFVKQMKRVSEPVLTSAFDDEDRRWFRERLTITPLGRAVLAEDVDWLSLSPPERWVGGVCISADRPRWRWDERLAMTVLH